MDGWNTIVSFLGAFWPIFRSELAVSFRKGILWTGFRKVTGFWGVKFVHVTLLGGEANLYSCRCRCGVRYFSEGPQKLCDVRFFFAFFYWSWKKWWLLLLLLLLLLLWLLWTDFFGAWWNLVEIFKGDEFWVRFVKEYHPQHKSTKKRSPWKESEGDKETTNTFQTAKWKFQGPTRWAPSSYKWSYGAPINGLKNVRTFQRYKFYIYILYFL